MRLATCTAGSVLFGVLTASFAYAYFFVQFLVLITIAVSLSFVVTILSAPQAKGERIVQKVQYEIPDGIALIERGEGGPDSLNLGGTLMVKKGVPAASGEVPDFSISFPLTKTNSSETKGSLKAGNEELAGFRSSIDSLLSLTANIDQGPAKTTKDFVGGSIISSDAKQAGSVKVDTRTFTKLKGKVSVKGDAFVEGGPNNGAAGKFKISVKFKPRKAEF